MRKIQKTAIVGGAVATLMAGGVAFAAWTSTGSDVGTATAGSQTGLVVDAGDVTGLYPSKDVTFPVTIANKNPYDVQVRSLDYTVVGSSTDKTGCSVDDVDVAIDDAVGDTILQGSEATPTVSDDYTATVTMHANAPTECQGAKFTLNFDASADSYVS
jgi:hypothetical protein